MSNTFTLFYLFDNRAEEIEIVAKHPDPEDYFEGFRDVFSFLNEHELSPSNRVIQKILQNS